MDRKEQKTAPGFEEKLQTVQELTAKIENGSLSLEDSVNAYETGMKILGELSAELEEINRRLTVLQNGKETETSDETV
ncbi:MAG: exodeoxyribonuclease VII small subunit [Clostridia bacterium]|nr:exodeoxyribonuclease VII small subunit [Clostridia bacterium]